MLYFHPLNHFQFDNIMDSEKNDEIKVICKNIESALQKLDWSIEEIQKRAEVAVPLLKHLENILR